MYPVDKQLSLPREKHSAGLGELAAIGLRAARSRPPPRRCPATGVRVGKRQAEQLARRAAADFGSFYAFRCRLVPTGDVLVLEADGKGIRIRPDSLRPQAARRAASAPGPSLARLLLAVRRAAASGWNRSSKMTGWPGGHRTCRSTRGSRRGQLPDLARCLVYGYTRTVFGLPPSAYNRDY